MNLNQIVALWACDGRAEQAFKQRQSFKGKRSGEVRLALNLDKREQAIELSKGGMKQKEIAAMLNVTDRTIRNWLAMHQNEHS